MGREQSGQFGQGNQKQSGNQPGQSDRQRDAQRRQQEERERQQRRNQGGAEEEEEEES